MIAEILSVAKVGGWHEPIGIAGEVVRLSFDVRHSGGRVRHDLEKKRSKSVGGVCLGMKRI